MPDKNTKTVIRTFNAWNDSKEEAWLQAQARRGWHLEAIKGLGYHFRRGKPEDVTYRLDFQSGGGKFDKTEYLGLFRDAGWEYVCRFGAWYFFRTPTGKGTPPEIHTDVASRAAKYRRLLLLMLIGLICSIPVASSFFGPLRWHNDSGIWIVFRGLQVGAIAFFAYGVIRLIMLVSKLKKSARGTEKI
ncbi:MAG: DUF2812 domain-containing protein [Candidatus Aminicenantes bacterium]|nr:DUF2812 domain-containing protein [Candidatus Aminicenantes bacterium]